MWAAAYRWVYDWQTLIAGLLALLAGGGTVWGTFRAANRQVKAANDAADREIKAANERRRIAREGYGFPRYAGSGNECRHCGRRGRENCRRPRLRRLRAATFERVRHTSFDNV
jgi:hypothetical protein